MLDWMWIALENTEVFGSKDTDCFNISAITDLLALPKNLLNPFSGKFLFFNF